jgi:hypothetical protein
MMGEFSMDAGTSSGREAGILLESLRDRSMEPRALTRQQLFVRLALVHRLQLDSHHHREPGQFREDWAQRVRTPHLI